MRNGKRLAALASAVAATGILLLSSASIAQTVTVNAPATVNVGRIVQGSTSTTFTADGTGAVNRAAGGTAVRLASNPASVILSASINCTGGNGNPCTKNNSSSSYSVGSGTKPAGAPVGTYSFVSLIDNAGNRLTPTSNTGTGNPAGSGLSLGFGQISNWPVTLTVAFTVVVSPTATAYGANSTPFTVSATLN